MTVHLSKGQAISLRKPDGSAPTVVRMSIGWQAAARRGLFGRRTREIGLDASAALFATDRPVDVVFFRHPTSDDGSVRHTSGKPVGSVGQGGDDEAILVDLQRVPTHIDRIVLSVNTMNMVNAVNSDSDQTFTELENTFCRLVDETSGQELARYTLSGGGQCPAQVMAKVQREGDGWRMSALGVPAAGGTFSDLLSAILPLL